MTMESCRNSLSMRGSCLPPCASAAIASSTTWSTSGVLMSPPSCCALRTVSSWATSGASLDLVPLHGPVLHGDLVPDVTNLDTPAISPLACAPLCQQSCKRQGALLFAIAERRRSVCERRLSKQGQVHANAEPLVAKGPEESQ